MSKGGGVDTSGVSRQVGLMDQLAQQAAAMGLTNYNTGVGLQKTYGDPTWQALLQMGGWGPGGGGQFTDPTASRFMQPVLQAGQQAATAAKKNLFNQNLGPGMQAAGAQQIDLQRMANAQTGALNLQQWVAQQLGAVGGQGLAMQGQAPSTLLGAGNLAGSAGGLEMQLAGMQLQAQQQGNMGLSGIFNTIGSLAGLGIMGGFGAFGGGGGGSSGGGGVGNLVANSLPIMMSMF